MGVGTGVATGARAPPVFELTCSSEWDPIQRVCHNPPPPSSSPSFHRWSRSPRCTGYDSWRAQGREQK